MQVLLFLLELYIYIEKREKNDAYLIVCLNLDRNEKKTQRKEVYKF